MKKQFNFISKVFILIFLSSCSHFDSVPTENPNNKKSKKVGQIQLYCPRTPAGTVIECAANLFKGAPVDKFIEIVKDSKESSALGLNFAKLTNYDGKEIYKPEGTFHHNPNQIVSFFQSTSPSGKWRDSGVMIQGTPTEIIFDPKGNPAYIGFGGQPVRLLEYEFRMGTDIVRVIPGQNYNQHPHGFSSPIGAVKNLPFGKRYFSDLTLEQIKEALVQMTQNGRTRIEYESGVVVEGELNFTKAFTASEDGRNPSAIAITFNEGTAEVDYNGRKLFEKDWGIYDMLIIDEFNTKESNIDAREPWVAPYLNSP